MTGRLDDNRDVQWVFDVFLGWLCIVFAAIPVLILAGIGEPFRLAAPWVLGMAVLAGRFWACAYTIIVAVKP